MSSPLLQSIKYFLKRWVLRETFLEAETKFFDIRMKARVSDMHGRNFYKRGVHDEELTRALIEHLDLQPGDVAFDIGANIGWYSMILDRVAPEGVDIFSFEPDPFNFQLLSDNIALNSASKVTAVNLGVSQAAESKTLYLYKSSNRGRHSLIPLHDGETVEIRTTSLDGFWEQRGLGDRVPRFIKLDVEGYEYFALEGASEVLARCQSLLMEYSPEFLRRAEVEPGELLELLVESGLKPKFGALVSSEQVGPVDLKRVLDEDAQCNIFWARD